LSYRGFKLLGVKCMYTMAESGTSTLCRQGNGSLFQTFRQRRASEKYSEQKTLAIFLARTPPSEHLERLRERGWMPLPPPSPKKFFFHFLLRIFLSASAVLGSCSNKLGDMTYIICDFDCSISTCDFVSRPRPLFDLTHF